MYLIGRAAAVARRRGVHGRDAGDRVEVDVARHARDAAAQVVVLLRVALDQDERAARELVVIHVDAARQAAEVVAGVSGRPATVPHLVVLPDDAEALPVDGAVVQLRDRLHERHSLADDVHAELLEVVLLELLEHIARDALLPESLLVLKQLHLAQPVCNLAGRPLCGVGTRVELHGRERLEVAHLHGIGARARGHDVVRARRNQPAGLMLLGLGHWNVTDVCGGGVNAGHK